MPADKNTIALTLIYQGEHFTIQIYANEYYSLLTLISEHLAIAGFGLCGGMGSCGTCLVERGSKYPVNKMYVMACVFK